MNASIMNMVAAPNNPFLNAAYGFLLFTKTIAMIDDIIPIDAIIKG